MHAKDVPEGTLRNILKQAGLTMDDFKKVWSFEAFIIPHRDLLPRSPFNHLAVCG